MPAEPHQSVLFFVMWMPVDKWITCGLLFRIDKSVENSPREERAARDEGGEVRAGRGARAEGLERLVGRVDAAGGDDLDAVREATSTALAALLQGAQAKGLIGPGDPREIGMRFGAILWRGDLRVRLLLRLADPPSPQDARDRARSATDAVLALYPAKSV